MVDEIRDLINLVESMDSGYAKTVLDRVNKKHAEILGIIERCRQDILGKI